MGQQQLLLLVLGAIIVGVSIVVGINLFGENAVQANQDAVVQDCMNVASRAQEWYRKPAAIGGGGRNFGTLGFDDLQMNSDPVNDTTANGTYVLSGFSSGGFTITGTGNELGVTVQMIVDSTGIVSTTFP